MSNNNNTVVYNVLNNIYTIVRQNGFVLGTLPDRLKSDYTIVRIAVRQNGLALEFASDELKNNKTIVSRAVQQNGLALEFASERLRLIIPLLNYIDRNNITEENQEKENEINEIINTLHNNTQNFNQYRRLRQYKYNR